MDVTLVMFRADGTRRDFDLPGSRWVIGRTNACDLRIPISSVSRQHCVLEVDADDNLRIRDLGSSNGTYLNQDRVQEAIASPGDQLSVGPVVFTIVIDGKPEKVPAVPTVVEAKGASSPDAKTKGKPAPEQLGTDDDELPDDFGEVELQTPTVELDDPIAALEALNDEGDEDIELPMVFDDDDDEDAKR
ncbi:MAG: FHA domain-containing protein [Phycisphaeraceae bacterium]|nr:FHA domain-containing protein [Phycisphaeraceae bacterium]